MPEDSIEENSIEEKIWFFIRVLSGNHEIISDYNSKEINFLKEILEQNFWRYRIEIIINEGKMHIKPLSKFKRK